MNYFHTRITIMAVIDQSKLPFKVKHWFFMQLIDKPLKKDFAKYELASNGVH